MSEDQQIHRVREVFNDWAQSGRAERMAAGHERAARHALQALQLRPGERFFDLGCGNGYSIDWASPLVGDRGLALGLDLAPEMIESARRVRSEAGPRRFQALDFADPHSTLVEFDAPFDAAMSIEALYYFSDLEAALRRIFELLRPGGRLAVVIDFYEENQASHGWPQRLDCFMDLRSAAGWRSVLEETGFDLNQQQRLRAPAESDAERWQIEEGSLFTLATRPA